MKPTCGGQGQGPATRAKVDGFRRVFARTVAIVGLPRLYRAGYLHLDLHAGCGWNELAGCDGSPVAFLKAAVAGWRHADLPIRAYFCERNPESADALAARLHAVSPSGQAGVVWRVLCCDNAAAVRQVLAEVRTPAVMGTLVCDPNGEREIPRAELREFFGRFRRVDAVWNVNFSVFRCYRGCKRVGMPGFADKPAVEDVMADMGKRAWWVRNPLLVPGQTFATLFGSNTDLRPSFASGLDFYPVEGETGRTILARLNRYETAPLLPGFGPTAD